MIFNAHKDIPRVIELGNILGFWRGSDRPLRSLTELTKNYRIQYLQEHALTTESLKTWTDRDTQRILERLSKDFLREHGAALWPDLPDRITFPEDERDLIQILRQLFWRQNFYEEKNLRSRGNPEDLEIVDPSESSPEKETARTFNEEKTKKTGLPPPSGTHRLLSRPLLPKESLQRFKARSPSGSLYEPSVVSDTDELRKTNSLSLNYPADGLEIISSRRVSRRLGDIDPVKSMEIRDSDIYDVPDSSETFPTTLKGSLGRGRNLAHQTQHRRTPSRSRSTNRAPVAPMVSDRRRAAEDPPYPSPSKRRKATTPRKAKKSGHKIDHRSQEAGSNTGAPHEEQTDVIPQFAAINAPALPLSADVGVDAGGPRVDVAGRSSREGSASLTHEERRLLGSSEAVSARTYPYNALKNNPSPSERRVRIEESDSTVAASIAKGKEREGAAISRESSTFRPLDRSLRAMRLRGKENDARKRFDAATASRARSSELGGLQEMSPNECAEYGHSELDAILGNEVDPPVASAPVPERRREWGTAGFDSPPELLHPFDEGLLPGSPSASSSRQPVSEPCSPPKRISYAMKVRGGACQARNEAMDDQGTQPQSTPSSGVNAESRTSELGQVSPEDQVPQTSEIPYNELPSSTEMESSYKLDPQTKLIFNVVTAHHSRPVFSLWEEGSLFGCTVEYFFNQLAKAVGRPIRKEAAISWFPPGREYRQIVAKNCRNHFEVLQYMMYSELAGLQVKFVTVNIDPDPVP